jgi:hypothetical protein
VGRSIKLRAMRSTRLALGFVLLSAGCSGSIDGTPANEGDSAATAQPDVGVTETSVVDPLADPTEDPTAGEEGQGDFDAGTPVEEAGVAVDAAPAIDAAAATDTGTKKSAASILVGEAARELAAMKESTYSHTTNVVESTGTFDYDCSGFIDYALSRVLPAQLASLASYEGVSRPLAKHYEAFFESIPASGSKGGWTRVSRAADLVPGDVVAWLKPADVVSTNTGHVLMVRGAVKPNPARADEILVPIYDSTSSPHGSTDSRAPSGEGLGTGTIGVLIDAKGAPVGYRWTGGVSVKLEYTSVALGHLEG